MKRLWREFEVSGMNDRKAYIRVLKKFENRYTGEIVRLVRVDYSEGTVDFQLLREEEFEDLLNYVVDNKNHQQEMEDFWNDI